jgi:hypothetical protein
VIVVGSSSQFGGTALPQVPFCGEQRSVVAASTLALSCVLVAHFYMLILDGVYTENKQGNFRFQRTRAPEQQELALLVHTVSQRIARFLERLGLVERDAEISYLQLDDIDDDPMQQVLGCSVSY